MKKWIIGVTAAALLAASGPTAFASDSLQRIQPAGGSSDAPKAVSGEFGSRTPMHHFDVRSSVQVSREELRDAYVASREAYTKKLQKYAKCSAKEAQKAISSAHPGAKINEVQLRNVRTSLVYFGLAEDGEYKYLVIVDAGNGKVLLDKPLPTHHERAFANDR